jgi:hypothetical protein
VKLFLDPSADGYTNMAKDADLLAFAEGGEPGARVYGWDGLWVSLGRFQKPEEDLLSPTTTPWVSRPTGGQAVVHGHDVTVSLALPLAMLRHGTRAVKDIYRVAAGPLIMALAAAGLPAVLAEGTRHVSGRPSGADCFAGTSPNDIVHRETGQKVCGCALRLTKSAVLLQASIPRWAPQLEPGALLREGKRQSPTEWNHEALPNALSAALRNVFRCRIGSVLPHPCPSRHRKAAIRLVLWNDWDPVGVNDMPENWDEYEDYVPPILQCLAAGGDVEQIARLLKHFRTDYMALRPTADHERGTASLLVALR